MWKTDVQMNYSFSAVHIQWPACICRITHCNLLLLISKSILCWPKYFLFRSLLSYLTCGTTVNKKHLASCVQKHVGQHTDIIQRQLKQNKKLWIAADVSVDELSFCHRKEWVRSRINVGSHLSSFYSCLLKKYHYIIHGFSLFSN